MTDRFSQFSINELKLIHRGLREFIAGEELDDDEYLAQDALKNEVAQALHLRSPISEQPRASIHPRNKCIILRENRDRPD